MKNVILTILFFTLTGTLYSQTRTIHVFVALCDNEFQGIVPVPTKIGNGKDPRLNLYWGAGYGVKSFFKLKTDDWVWVQQLESTNPFVLDRILFKHATEDVYLLADAYDGEQIKLCTENFLKAANGQNPETLWVDNQEISFGGGANLIAYIGHDGLMEFEVSINYQDIHQKPKDVIILACYSRDYFSPQIKLAQANPLVWTTHLMAPEAYTLKAALTGWIANETGTQMEERAAQAYHKYQKCGINGARNLFTTGFK